MIQPVTEDGGSIPNVYIEIKMPKFRETFERTDSIHEASGKEIDTSDFIEMNQAMLVIRAVYGHTTMLQTKTTKHVDMERHAVMYSLSIFG